MSRRIIENVACQKQRKNRDDAESQKQKEEIEKLVKTQGAKTDGQNCVKK